MPTGLDAWDPASLQQVTALFRRFDGAWWIAGGLSIDLAVGRTVREHADTDVVVLRVDHERLHRCLAGWELCAADPPGQLRRWLPGTALPETVHDIWCRPLPGSNWRIQVMIDESEGDTWVSRRSQRVRMSLDRIGHRTADGVPFLAAEVQLFYKARSPRPKDQLDFDAVLPHLTPPQRAWLDDALDRTVPDHPWRRRLLK